MDNDFFDQDTGRDEDGTPMMERPSGANILVNGSYQPLEVGAPFIQEVQKVALQAGFGKFKCFLNGTEVRPKTAAIKDRLVETDDRVEIRPFDEAGYWVSR